MSIISRSLAKITALLFFAFLFQSCTEQYITPSNKPSSEANVDKAVSKQKNNQAFTASIRPVVGEFVSQSITLDGAPGASTVTINWGDGTIETYRFEDWFGTPRVEAEHVYAAEIDYTVIITGDLKNVIGVSDPFTTATIHWMNFDNLPNLESVDMPYNDIETLDLSKNRKLKSVYSPPTVNIQNVILPQKHNINFISVTGPNIPAQVIDNIIENIYKNAVRNQTYNGNIDLASMMGEDPQFAGPPSEESMELLRILRDDWGWTIFPNP